MSGEAFAKKVVGTSEKMLFLQRRKVVVYLKNESDTILPFSDGGEDSEAAIKEVQAEIAVNVELGKRGLQWCDEQIESLSDGQPPKKQKKVQTPEQLKATKEKREGNKVMEKNTAVLCELLGINDPAEAVEQAIQAYEIVQGLHAAKDTSTLDELTEQFKKDAIKLKQFKDLKDDSELTCPGILEKCLA